MGERREWRSFAVVMLVIAACCATVTSCGSGGKGASTNGNLCDQCGDTGGPCVSGTIDLTGDDRLDRCKNSTSSTDTKCTVELRCVRKVDSGQRRCFPFDPTTGQIDFFYECDGSRPVQSFAPTLTPTTTPTLTPVASVTSTPAETATGPTPTATGPTPSGATPTVTTEPEPTATPAPADVDVDISVTTDADEFTASFTVTVRYPPSKGTFASGGTLTCDGDTEGLTATDDGSGTLTLSFAADTERSFSNDVTCTFHQLAGQALAEIDLNGSVIPDDLLDVGVTIP
jgi:hypothetical protein